MIWAINTRGEACDSKATADSVNGATAYCGNYVVTGHSATSLLIGRIIPGTDAMCENEARPGQQRMAEEGGRRTADGGRWTVDGGEAVRRLHSALALGCETVVGALGVGG